MGLDATWISDSLWVALEVEMVYAVGADLAIVASFCLPLGRLLRLYPGDRMSKFVLFGLIRNRRLVFGTADYTVRILMHHLAVPGNGPNSTASDLIVAERLNELGSGPGSKVAIIGDGTGAY